MEATFAKRVELARDIYQRVTRLGEPASGRFTLPAAVICYKDDSTDRYEYGIALTLGRRLFIHAGRLCRLRSWWPCCFIEEIKLDEEPLVSLSELQQYLQRL